MSMVTSFSPNFNNKTTSVENELSHIINLIISFLAKGLLKLANEVRVMLAFIRTTEVILFRQLGKNEIFVSYHDGYGSFSPRAAPPLGAGGCTTNNLLYTYTPNELLRILFQ